MARERKTFEVAEFRDAVNGMLRDSVDGAGMSGVREGLSAALERVLHDTGNYRGYSYLPGELTDDGKALREGADKTRRRYS